VERTEQALKLQPGNGVSHHLMSWALSEQGRWAEPADARRRVIELGEDVWQPWTWLADLQARAGDSDAARAAQQTAHERAGTDEERAQIDSLAMQLTPVDSIGVDSTESTGLLARVHLCENLLHRVAEGIVLQDDSPARRVRRA